MAAPSAQVIANAFVEQYYHILHHNPEVAYRFYQDTSLLSRPDSNGLMTTVTTMKTINDKICSLDYKNYKAEIKTVDAQDSYKNGVIVLVTGYLTGRDNLRMRFTQSFFLAPQDNGFYVLNDIFRYWDKNKPYNSSVDIGVQETALEPIPEPASVVDSLNTDHTSSQVLEVEIVEGAVADQVIDEQQVVDDTDKPAEADLHLHENHVSVAAESLPSSSHEDAPKKSYASIVSTQTKKGPVKVYVPSNTTKAVPEKIEKETLNTADHPAPESSSPVALDGAPESKDTQDEVEGHSIYIRNLPLNVTISQVESEFQKFGPVKPNGVQVICNRHLSNQQGFCFGFVEFLEFSSMQHAIKASPITIGDRQAAVEIKKTTTRVGGGRGPFTPPRGGYRNENFRGRGNYNGGRTYVRSDSVRGRGNFSIGRNGEGYQQGRGRGSGRSFPTQNSAST